MKKYFLMMLLSSCSMVLLAQSWQTGTNVMYVNPTSTKVGIGTATPLDLLNVDGGTLRIGKTSSATDRALNLLKFGDGSYVQIGEWEANNTLSFKASKYSFNTGYLGVGVSNPEYKLDVNGKVRLKTAYAEDGWGYSYLYWDIHSLVMGTPPGHHAHCAVDLMPGGEDLNNDTLLSQFRMYSAPSSTSKIMRIYLYLYCYLKKLNYCYYYYYHFHHFHSFHLCHIYLSNFLKYFFLVYHYIFEIYFHNFLSNF